jgi:hypothetical protein
MFFGRQIDLMKLLHEARGASEEECEAEIAKLVAAGATPDDFFIRLAKLGTRAD